MRDATRCSRKGLPEPAPAATPIWWWTYANNKNGQQFASVPVAIVYSSKWVELYRYVE